MWLPKPEPHIPPDHDVEVVMAIRAIQSGTANAAQQMLFWKYLAYVTGTSDEFADLSYRPAAKGGPEATGFAEGKRFVGLMMRKLLRPEFTPKPRVVDPPATIQKRFRARAQKRAA